MPNTHTYADGFGTWHARVPSGPTARNRARYAIRRELTARGEVGPGYRIRIELAPVWAQHTDGTVTYRETVDVHPAIAALAR